MRFPEANSRTHPLLVGDATLTKKVPMAIAEKLRQRVGKTDQMKIHSMSGPDGLNVCD